MAKKQEEPKPDAGALPVSCTWCRSDLIVIGGVLTLCPVCDWVAGGAQGPPIKGWRP